MAILKDKDKGDQYAAPQQAGDDDAEEKNDNKEEERINQLKQEIAEDGEGEAQQTVPEEMPQQPAPEPDEEDKTPQPKEEETAPEPPKEDAPKKPEKSKDLKERAEKLKGVSRVVEDNVKSLEEQFRQELGKDETAKKAPEKSAEKTVEPKVVRDTLEGKRQELEKIKGEIDKEVNDLELKTKNHIDELKSLKQTIESEINELKDMKALREKVDEEVTNIDELRKRQDEIEQEISSIEKQVRHDDQ